MEYWTRSVCYPICYTPDEGCDVGNTGHAVFAILYAIHLTEGVMYGILDTRCLLSFMPYT